MASPSSLKLTSIEDAEVICSYLCEMSPDALLADGFHRALVGVVGRCDMDLVALYDIDLCILKLMEVDGLTEEDAVEYFEFNVIGAYVGDGAPCFARFPHRDTVFPGEPDA